VIAASSGIAGVFPFNEQEMTEAKKKDRNREDEKYERQVGAESQEISHKVLGTPPPVCRAY
jgi:hypothetical protein